MRKPEPSPPQPKVLSPQQAQTVLIIDQYLDKSRREGGRLEIDTAPTPIRPIPKGAKSAVDSIKWPVDHMYASSRILVREEHLEHVRRIVRGLGGGRPESGPVNFGLRTLSLPSNVGVLEALGQVRKGGKKLEGLGAGVAAPDHLISITGGPGIIAGAGATCPACEPYAVDAGTAPFPPPVADPTAGAGVRVVVIDTGIDRRTVAAHSWLNSAPAVDGEDDPAVSGDHLGPYAGHGTFIAGVIRSVAPAAEVYVRADFRVLGLIFESDLVRALDDVLTNDNPDIISLSAGVWSGDMAGPLGFQVFAETRLRHHKGVVVVAAAGNDASRRPFWPAAAPWTVSVGALCAEENQRASFSNFGGWVDVYAPGENLINAFPTGTYHYNEPPNVTVHPGLTGHGTHAVFTGMAGWSGTSFATPMVAGMIAARMSATGENGVAAAKSLMDAAQTMYGTGKVLLSSHRPTSS